MNIHRLLLTTACIALLTTLTACSGLHHPNTCGPKGAQNVSFDTLLQSQGSGTEQAQRFLLIQSQQEFREAWDELFVPNPPPSPLPTVDFQTESVLIYAMGTQPNGCYSTEIQSVRGQNGELVATVRELEPAPNCTCTLALVAPFHVVRIAKHTGPASVCVARDEREC